VELDGDTVRITMSNLGARRLMLGLGVNTDRYGPEVRQLLDQLAINLLGVQRGRSGLESSTPHRRGHPGCQLCVEIFGEVTALWPAR
jgi:hypothetical protein